MLALAGIVKLTVKSIVAEPDSENEFRTGDAGTAEAGLMPVASPAITRIEEINKEVAFLTRTSLLLEDFFTFSKINLIPCPS